MRWWGWVALAVGGCVVWLGIASVGEALHQLWRGDQVVAFIARGLIVIIGICVAAPAVLVTRRRSNGAEVLLHVLALLVLFLLSIVLLDFVNGGVLCLVIVIAYVAWNFLSAERAFNTESGTQRGATRALIGSFFIFVHLALGPILAIIFAGFLILVNIVLKIDGIATDLFIIVGLAILLFAVGSAFLFAVALQIAGFERWSSIRSLVRKPWLTAIWGQMLIATPAGLALYGMGGVAWIGDLVSGLGSTGNLSWSQHTYSVLIGYPTLLVLLAGAAVTLASHRALVFQLARFKAGKTHHDAIDAEQLRRTNLARVFASLLIGAVVITFASAKEIRTGLVVIWSGVPTFDYAESTHEAINGWIKRSIDGGLSTESLVAQLNAKGHWTSERPEQGFLEIFPELREEFTKDLTCTMRVASGALSDEEKLAAAQLDASKDAKPIKYCLKAVCHWTHYGEGDSVTWLVSSHPSKMEGWFLGHITTTMLFDQIHASGGFCTTSGELADGYQG